MHAWHVARVQALARPVPVSSTGQTGFGPRRFDVTFLPSDQGVVERPPSAPEGNGASGSAASARRAQQGVGVSLDEQPPL